MLLTPEWRNALIDVIARNVPPGTLAEVVREQGVITDFEVLRKEAPEEPDQSWSFVVTRVVDAYEKVRQTDALATEIYRRSWRDDQFAAQIVPFAVALQAGDGAKEAALALRANTLRARELREFISECEARICVIVAVINGPEGTEYVRGTGFLVGPDLVMTAYHTIKSHIDNGHIREPVPGPLYAFFDHFSGDPITDPTDARVKALRVQFHQNWLVDSCEDMPNEGRLRNPTADECDLLTHHLDYALVRLAEKVGSYTRRSSGGARRAWIDMQTISSAIAKGDRIIIPQHPFGYSQRIDFGRFSEADMSASRLRYDTETDKGTSGAPCFKQDFSLVGMHVSTFEPDGIPLANQAIRVDLIAPRLAGHLAAMAQPREAARVWSASNDIRNPRVILGRALLLDWIEVAAAPAAGELASRCYSAVSDIEGSGRRFSIDILRSARQDSGEPIVVLGGKERIPSTVQDFVQALAYELRIPQEHRSGIPPRPSSDLPPGSADGDKLRRWASEEVPVWFDGVLRRHRAQVVDRRIEAQETVKVFADANRSPPQDAVDLANAPDPVIDTRNRWNVAWIILLLTDESPSAEVLDLIGGLIGANAPEFIRNTELGRLRWLFLGGLPDFLAAGPGRATQERLDPMTIGVPEMIAGIHAMAESFSLPFEGASEAWLRAAIQAMLDGPAKADATDPSRRMMMLQSFLSAMVPGCTAMMGLPS